jgi:hypothetical protein
MNRKKWVSVLASVMAAIMVLGLVSSALITLFA